VVAAFVAGTRDRDIFDPDIRLKQSPGKVEVFFEGVDYSIDVPY